jgi:hypothetical protein
MRHFADGASMRPVPIDKWTHKDIVAPCLRLTRDHDDRLYFKQAIFFCFLFSQDLNERFAGSELYIVYFQMLK